MDLADEEEQIVERVAGLDVGKAEVVCCVRVPDRAHRLKRAQEVRTCSTMTAALVELAQWLRELGVSRVVMESTSDYWKPVFYAFEAAGFEPWLVNARDVKHLPGRAKTDRLDAVWLCKLAERQMLRPSFVPPPPVRRLRDLTRYRCDLVGARTAEKQRVEKLLEDAQIKLSVVASDIFGVSGRAMLAALVAGERDPARLAELARTVLRRKTPALQEAFTGAFTEHHAYLLAMMLGRVEALEASIAELDTRIESHLVQELGHAQLGSFNALSAVRRLDAIPGIGAVAATAIIAEIGLDMSRFPTAQHLCAWAKFAPITRESAGKSKPHVTGKGNTYLARMLGDAVAGAARTHTFLGARYQRLARRRGKNRAIVAVGRSMLTVIWQLLRDPEAEFIELGPDHYEHQHNQDRQVRNHIRHLQSLGYRVTLEPAA